MEPTKLIRLRVIGGSGLAKKDIFGARLVYIHLFTVHSLFDCNNENKHQPDFTAVQFLALCGFSYLNTRKKIKFILQVTFTEVINVNL